MPTSKKQQSPSLWNEDFNFDLNSSPVKKLDPNGNIHFLCTYPISMVQQSDIDAKTIFFGERVKKRYSVFSLLFNINSLSMVRESQRKRDRERVPCL